MEEGDKTAAAPPAGPEAPVQMWRGDCGVGSAQPPASHREFLPASHCLPAHPDPPLSPLPGKSWIYLLVFWWLRGPRTQILPALRAELGAEQGPRAAAGLGTGLQSCQRFVPKVILWGSGKQHALALVVGSGYGSGLETAGFGVTDVGGADATKNAGEDVDSCTSVRIKWPEVKSTGEEMEL